MVVKLRSRAAKQHELIEDAAMVYKIQGSPERRVWYVDTGDMTAERSREMMDKLKKDLDTWRLPQQDMIEHRYQPVIDWMKERGSERTLYLDHHTMLDEEGVLHLLDKVTRTRHNLASSLDEGDENSIHRILLNRSCNLVAKSSRKGKGNCIIPCNNGVMVTYAADLDNRAWDWNDVPGIYYKKHDLLYVNIADLSNYFLFWKGNTIDILNFTKDFSSHTNCTMSVVQNKFTEQGRGVMKW